MKELLDYREGTQGDVEPVRVDREPGCVRVVARYPHRARVWARNRFLIALAVSLGWMLGVSRMMMLYPRGYWGVLGSFWMIFGIVVLVMGRLWWRAASIYVFQVKSDELRVEEKGLLWRRVRHFEPQHIVDVRVARTFRGRAHAVEIATRYPKVPRMWLDGLTESQLVEVTDALREGLGMKKEMLPYNQDEKASAAGASSTG